MRKRLNEEAIDALVAKRKRYLVYDSIVPGLAVRVSPKAGYTAVATHLLWTSHAQSQRRSSITTATTLRLEGVLRPGLVCGTTSSASADNYCDNRCNEQSHGLPR